MSIRAFISHLLNNSWGIYPATRGVGVITAPVRPQTVAVANSNQVTRAA